MISIVLICHHQLSASFVELFLFNLQVQKDKVKHGDSLSQGKKKMTFEAYELMCNLLLKEKDEAYVFAHLYLTLEWNLMSRSENVNDCHAENIIWLDDALGFHFPKSKTDQLGKRGDAVWHVYANPGNPAVCPILALARYLFSFPGILTPTERQPLIKQQNSSAGNISINGYGKLFPGDSQYERFMACFRKVIRDHPDEFKRVGVDSGDLGSHSVRKGSCSYAAAGTTVAPPIVSICLRAMWSMGGVKERYLSFEKAGDQYLGRVITGMDCNEASFATSPPYFDFTGCDDSEKKDKMLDQIVSNFMVGGVRLTPRVFHIVKMCYASLCYHSDFLKNTLHKESYLQSSPFFTQIPKALQQFVCTRLPWSSTSYTPKFTGMFSVLVMFTALLKLTMFLLFLA